MDSNPTVVFTQPHQVVIEEREKPTPTKGQLLIRTRITLISTGTELTILNAEYPPDSAWSGYGKFPFVPGYDNIGEVIAVGPEVSEDWRGRRVATPGPHARFVCMPADSARVIQRDIADEPATFFAIAEVVMNGVRRGRVQWGEAVVVFGLGLLGQLTVRFCHLAGARPVFAVDIADSRLQHLPQDSMIVPVNPTAQDVAAVVEEATRGRKADVAFEVTGAPELIPEEFATLRQGGRFVVLSSPRGQTLFNFDDLCSSAGFTIIGAHNWTHPPCATADNPWTQHRHAELFFDLVADGELDLAPLISHQAHYTEAPRLYQMLVDDRSPAMGVILQWSD